MKQFISHNKKKLIITGIAILVLAGIIFMPRTTTVQSVVSETAVKGSLSIKVSASGNVVPETSYTITPRLAAKVVEVDVKAGDKVAKDQLLLKLDDTELQNAVKIAMYNFNAAVYKRDQLKAAPSVDDNAVKQAQQQINTTSIQLQTARNNLNNALIYSPIAGEILTLNLKVDDFSSIATPALIVADTSKLEAVLNVNEIDINKVQVGQNVALTIDAIGGTRTAKVMRIDNNSVVQTATQAGVVNYQVHNLIDNQTSLKPGMTIDAEIEVQTKNDVILVPSAAIQEKNGKSYIKIALNDGSRASDIIEKEVIIGLNNNTNAEVISGINVNDKVVINIINKNSIATNSIFGRSSN